MFPKETHLVFQQPFSQAGLVGQRCWHFPWHNKIRWSSSECVNVALSRCIGKELELVGGRIINYVFPLETLYDRQSQLLQSVWTQIGSPFHTVFFLLWWQREKRAQDDWWVCSPGPHNPFQKLPVWNTEVKNKAQYFILLCGWFQTMSLSSRWASFGLLWALGWKRS